MSTCKNIRWAPFCVFFGLQRWLWWIILKLLIPDCKDFVDARILAKEGTQGGAETEGNSKIILDEIYKLLGILDSKASALMRYNSIILAVLALMVKGTTLPHVTIYIVVMTIVSILACLLVVGVYWRFLEWVKPTGSNRLEEELQLLRRVLIMREAAYQIAWWMSAAVLLLFLLNFREFVASITPAVTPKAG